MRRCHQPETAPSERAGKKNLECISFSLQKENTHTVKKSMSRVSVMQRVSGRFGNELQIREVWSPSAQNNRDLQLPLWKPYCFYFRTALAVFPLWLPPVSLSLQPHLSAIRGTPRRQWRSRRLKRTFLTTHGGYVAFSGKIAVIKV